MHIKKLTQKDRYGNQMSYEFEVPEKGVDQTKLMEKAMELGVPPMTDMSMGMEMSMGNPATHPGGPKGSDTVPAWLTPGEFVVNAEAMQVPGVEEQITDINNMGREIQMAKKGGMMPQGYQQGGKVAKAIGQLVQEQKQEVPFVAGPLLTDDAMYAQQGMAVPTPGPWTKKPAGIDELLHEREGFVPEIYLDSLGKPTVGYGHLIEDAVWDKNDPRVGTKPYSEAQLKEMFESDRAKAQSEAVENVGRETFTNLTPEQQTALTSMAFQLGGAGQRKFKNMLNAIKEGNYDEAAKQALTGSKGGKSKWLKQTPKRAMDLAMAFSPNIAAQYKAAGGAVYASDGGWQSFLNKYVLGPKTQLPVGDVDTMGGVDTPSYPWQPPVPGIPTYMTGEEGGLGTAPTGTRSIPALGDPYDEVGSDEARMADALANYKAQRAASESGASVPNLGGITAYPGIEDTGVQGAVDSPEDAAAFAAAEKETAINELVGTTDFGNAAETRAAIDKVQAAEAEEARRLREVERQELETNRWNAASRASELQEAANKAQRKADALAAAGLSVQAEQAQIEADELMSQYDDAQAEVVAAEVDVDEHYNEAAEEVAAGEAAKAPPAKPKDILENPGDPSDTPVVEPDTPEGEAKIDEAIAGASNEENQKAQNEARGLFKELGLDGLFDKKELARMAVMYAGSRLLGHSHSGSLNWAAKNYIGRVDAKEQGYSKLALSGKYKPESLAKFKKSGDFSDLEAIGATPTITGNSKTRMVNGQTVAFQEVKVGDNVMYKGPKGNLYTDAQLENNFQPDVPAFRKGTPEYRARRSRATGDAAGRFEEVWKAEDTIPGGRDKPDSHFTKIRPKQAADEFWAWSEGMGLDPESDEALQVMTNAYRQAIADGQTGDVKPASLKPYLQQEYIREKTGSPELFQTSEGGYIRGDKMDKLNRNVEHVAASLPALQGLAPQDASSRVYDVAVGEWNKLSQEERDQYTSSATDSESGFYVFLNKRLADIATKV